MRAFTISAQARGARSLQFVAGARPEGSQSISQPTSGAGPGLQLASLEAKESTSRRATSWAESDPLIAGDLLHMGQLGGERYWASMKRGRAACYGEVASCPH